MEVAEEIDRERRKNKLVIMGVPEEGEDGGGSGIAEKVIKELIPESEVCCIRQNWVEERRGTTTTEN